MYAKHILLLLLPFTVKYYNDTKYIGQVDELRENRLAISYLQASVGVALVQFPGVVEASPGEEREEQVPSDLGLVL